MRPKLPPPTTTTNIPQFTAPPPPSSKLLDEREIGDDFRRSIDAALKGLESIYQTSTEHTHESHIDKLADNIHQKKVNEPSISQTDIQTKRVDNMNERMLDTSESQIGKEGINPLTNQSSSLENQESISSPQQKVKLSNENRPKSFNVTEENLNKNQYNFNKQTSFDETGRHVSKSTNKNEEKLSTSVEEHNKTLSESLLTPVVEPVDMNTTLKSPSHNVTYTEIIQSESRDGEQSRRFITQSYDELPSKDDEKTTTLKVVTKSEFSNHPSLGEKIMEQSVQIITVKVRNETIKTTNSSQTSDNDISYEKQSIKNDVNPLDTMI